MIIAVYLLAIVLANLSSATFGPGASIVNAFLLIGLDLTARDRLHEAWHGRGLAWKMGALILSGSALSYLLNQAALSIAVASCAAFGLAALVDTLVYALLGKRARLLRVNGSNVVSGLMDSVVFVGLAFGWGLVPVIAPAQWAAKVLGGFIWSVGLDFLATRRRSQADAWSIRL